MRRDAWDTIGGIPFEAAPHEPHGASVEELDAWMQRT
jgi:hypothetical protein